MKELTPVKMNLSREFFERNEKRGRVQSCFDKAVNLSFRVNGEERLLTLQREGGILLPDSIVLSVDDFCQMNKCGFPLDRYVIIENNTLYIGPKELYLGHAVNQSLYLPDFGHGFCERGFAERLFFLMEYHKENGKKSDLERLPERYRSALARLAKGCIEGEREEAGRAFEALAGVGKGLTPSGDDAVLGVLAVMRALEKKEKFEEISSVILTRILGGRYTTKVSEKYLKCACRGQFAEALCRLAAWLISGKDGEKKDWINQIMQTGHTSGADMLYGMETVCRAVYRKWYG